MAQIETVSFGAELKDGYNIVDVWVGNGITWLAEIQEFYRERSMIEREYSTKLAALAKKYYDKKAKRSSNLSVGDTPALTPGSLESASLTTWTTQITTLEARAEEHARLASEYDSLVSDPLRSLQSKFEELRRSHTEYQNKLVKERDSSYADLKKLKTKYDAVCQEVESKRKKQSKSYNHQLAEMNNTKNTYLISINVTNKMKECYYHSYIPELLDSLQDLSETRTASLNQVWLTAAAIETKSLERSRDHMVHLSKEIPRNIVSLDSIMFVRHNAVHWQEPPPFMFEPSPVWLDTDAMMTDETSKVFLRNILTKSKPIINQMKADGQQKQRELANVKRARENIRSGKDRRSEVDCVKSQFAVMEEMHDVERKRLTAEVETATVTAVVGDLDRYGKSHTFKSETFKIPTNCDFCAERIWGLSAKGFICVDCGYTCHSKCQMKVPAECPGEQTKEEKKRLKIERQAAAGVVVSPPGTPNGAGERSPLSRQNTMNSLASGYSANAAARSASGVHRVGTQEMDSNPANPFLSAAPSNAGSARRSRIVAPPPTSYVSSAVELPGSPSGVKKGKMLYAYEAREAGELTIEEGKEVTIVSGDDGGWTKVKASFGKEGLVPTAYVEEIAASSYMSAGNGGGSSMYDRPGSAYSDSNLSIASSNLAAKKKGPAVAPKRGARKVKYCEALYAYTARSDAEFDMNEGEKFILVSMGTGDGWADVEKGGETRSVPANYIKEI